MQYDGLIYSQGDNGVALVEFLDGSQVMVSSTVKIVVFTDASKVTRVYASRQKLPEVLEQKLNQVTFAISYLNKPFHPVGANAGSHHVGIR